MSEPTYEEPTSPGTDEQETAERDIEAPDDDVFEQRASSFDEEDDETVREAPLEADPADAVEQDRSAGRDDEDDYR